MKKKLIVENVCLAVRKGGFFRCSKLPFVEMSTISLKPEKVVQKIVRNSSVFLEKKMLTDLWRN